MDKPCAGAWLGFEIDCDISKIDPDGRMEVGLCRIVNLGVSNFGW